MSTNVTVSFVGKQGPRGNTILPASGPPASGVGVGGDYALDTSALALYGPKGSNGVWPGPYSLGSAVPYPISVAHGGTGVTSVDAIRQLLEAWTFPVTAYGAKVDGQRVHDAALGASGGGSANIVTCSVSSPFVSGDVGKAYALKNVCEGTITAVLGPTQVQISTPNPSTAVTGGQFVWGTDDSAAVNAALAAGWAYATTRGAAQGSGAGYLKVKFPPGLCMIAGPLLHTYNGNAQIPIPLRATTLSKIQPEFEGSGDASSFQHWEQLDLQSCSTLFSVGRYASPTAQTNDINAHGNPACIGGPNPTGGYGVSPGVFNNVRPVLRNLSIRTTHDSRGLTWGAADFYGCAEAGVENFLWGTAGNVADGDYNSVPSFGTGFSIGFFMPAPGNNDNSRAQNISCQGGYTFAGFFPEHFVTDRIGVLYCWAGLCPVGTYAGSVASVHAINFGQASVEACVYHLCAIGVGSGGQGPWVYGVLDVEGTVQITDRLAPVAGQGLNALLGEMQVVGEFDPTTINLEYPTGLKLRNGMQGYPFRIITSATSSALKNVLVTDEGIGIDCSGGNVTVTLTSAAWTPNQFTIERLDASGNTCTVAAAGSETIAGAASFTLVGQYASARVWPRRIGGVWSWGKK